MTKKLADAIEDMLAGVITMVHLYRAVKYAPKLLLKVRRAHVSHIQMAKEMAGIGTVQEQAYMQVTDHLLYHWGTFTWPQIEPPKA